MSLLSRWLKLATFLVILSVKLTTTNNQRQRRKAVAITPLPIPPLSLHHILRNKPYQYDQLTQPISASSHSTIYGHIVNVRVIIERSDIIKFFSHPKFRKFSHQYQATESPNFIGTTSPSNATSLSDTTSLWIQAYSIVSILSIHHFFKHAKSISQARIFPSSFNSSIVAVTPGWHSTFKSLAVSNSKSFSRNRVANTRYSSFLSS